MLNGNQLRELRMLQAMVKNYPNTTIPQGWTKHQLNVRRQLCELGYLEVIEPNATFRHYKLTKQGVLFRG